MAYKQKSSPFNHVNSWEEEDVKRGRKLEKEGKKGHADALYDDAHDSYNWKGGRDGSEHHSPLSFMSKHSKSSPLHKEEKKAIVLDEVGVSANRIDVNKEYDQMFDKFKSSYSSTSGTPRRSHLTQENFSSLMKDEAFKARAKQNPYYGGLKQAYQRTQNPAYTS